MTVSAISSSTTCLPTRRRSSFRRRVAQRRIGALLSAGAGGRLHEAHYNLVAYPWSTEYQNSNQWVLETIAAALADRPIASRTRCTGVATNGRLSSDNDPPDRAGTPGRSAYPRQCRVRRPSARPPDGRRHRSRQRRVGARFRPADRSGCDVDGDFRRGVTMSARMALHSVSGAKRRQAARCKQDLTRTRR